MISMHNGKINTDANADLLAGYLREGKKVVFSAPRRAGKTALVAMVAHRMDGDVAIAVSHPMRYETPPGAIVCTYDSLCAQGEAAVDKPAILEEPWLAGGEPWKCALQAGGRLFIGTPGHEDVASPSSMAGVDFDHTIVRVYADHPVA